MFTIGVPEMVTIPLRTLNPIPAGNPVTVAPVAPSNNWYSISAIGVFSHSICASVPAGEIKLMNMTKSK